MRRSIACLPLLIVAASFIGVVALLGQHVASKGINEKPSPEMCEKIPFYPGCTGDWNEHEWDKPQHSVPDDKCPYEGNDDAHDDDDQDLKDLQDLEDLKDRDDHDDHDDHDDDDKDDDDDNDDNDDRF